MENGKECDDEYGFGTAEEGGVKKRIRGRGWDWWIAGQGHGTTDE